jgi:hypothetical protein
MPNDTSCYWSVWGSSKPSAAAGGCRIQPPSNTHILMRTKPIHYHYLYVPSEPKLPAIPLIPCSMLQPSNDQIVTSYPGLVTCRECKEWLYRWKIAPTVPVIS